MNNYFDRQAREGIDPDGDSTIQEHMPGDMSADSDADTPQNIKLSAQELLKYGLLEADRKPNLFHIATRHFQQINRVLEPLDLELRIDEVRGLAFVVVRQASDDFNDTSTDSTSEEDEWSHPLVRRQRLTLEHSLLIAILRQLYLAHEQEAGMGAGNAVVLVDEITSHTQMYFKPTGSDAQDQKRIRSLLENLRSHHIVSEVDDNDQLSIRPLITHLVNPQALQALVQHYKFAGNH